MNKRPRRLFGEICMCSDPTIWPDLTIEIEKSVDAILGVIHEYRGDIHEYRGDIHEYRGDIHLSCDIAILRDIARYS